MSIKDTFFVCIWVNYNFISLYLYLFCNVSCVLILFNLCPQYPMYSRDYVYVRRYDVDVENNLMIMVSR